MKHDSYTVCADGEPIGLSNSPDAPEFMRYPGWENAPPLEFEVTGRSVMFSVERTKTGAPKDFLRVAEDR